MERNSQRFSVWILSFCMIALLPSCTTTHVGQYPVAHTIYGTNVVAADMRQGLYHLVAPGETLWRISKMYNVDVDTIKEVNNIRNVKDLEIGTELYIPDAAPRRNVITLYDSSRWKHIIIHHSATDSGNTTEFNNAHLKRGWQGIGYHFVIDNGTCGKDDGQIEMSPRWIKQMEGAHCKADGMNKRAIGICLVGNFSEDRVSAKQMTSLVYLVNNLREHYTIPKRNILGHSQVPQAKTECPGRYFPWKKFWRLIRS